MIVRQSKVRHVFGSLSKSELQYQDLRLSTATGDHNYIKANDKYFAVSVSTGGGSLTVVPLSRYGKLPPCLPVFDGHHGAVLDFEFSPFHSQLIASGGDDCTVKLWRIPEDGLVETSATPLVDLRQHCKKVTILRYHPTANNVLASGSADRTVKVWDVQQGMVKSSNECAEGIIQDVVWNQNGSLLASSSKDKMLRVVDPRTGQVTMSAMAHLGTKTSKLTFIDDRRICSVGFTRTSKRQFKLWDPRNLDAGPTETVDIDQGSGSLMPFFDESLNILYLSGKGDGNIKFYEIGPEKSHYLNNFTTSIATKGLAVLPKRSCDVWKCEVNRFLKLTRDSVLPVSFICPRKASAFQRDLYPDCYAGKPSLSADEFFEGIDRKPLTMSLERSPGEALVESKQNETNPIFKSSKEIQEELDGACQYIGILKNELQKHGLAIPSPPFPLAV